MSVCQPYFFTAKFNFFLSVKRRKEIIISSYKYSFTAGYAFYYLFFAFNITKMYKHIQMSLVIYSLCQITVSSVRITYYHYPLHIIPPICLTLL